MRLCLEKCYLLIPDGGRYDQLYEQIQEYHQDERCLFFSGQLL